MSYVLVWQSGEKEGVSMSAGKPARPRPKHPDPAVEKALSEIEQQIETARMVRDIFGISCQVRI